MLYQFHVAHKIVYIIYLYIPISETKWTTNKTPDFDWIIAKHILVRDIVNIHMLPCKQKQVCGLNKMFVAWDAVSAMMIDNKMICFTEIKRLEN